VGVANSLLAGDDQGAADGEGQEQLQGGDVEGGGGDSEEGVLGSHAGSLGHAVEQVDEALVADGDAFGGAGGAGGVDEVGEGVGGGDGVMG